MLRRDLDWAGVVALETHQLELPGVSLRVGPRRNYPYGPLAAHLLGYVGEVSESELGGRPATYRAGDLIGKAGLEKAWDDELRGVRGGQQVEVDALGRELRVLEEVPDVPGDTLVLTHRSRPAAGGGARARRPRRRDRRARSAQRRGAGAWSSQPVVRPERLRARHPAATSGAR